ncbi:hypothetical protein GF318_05405 [Candidatus Micrarchaeota archaeon]|nr:hypothetical protein [Candidatus Micrarchaeota archaeon]
MGICSRCGRKTETEYGADGLPYCNACSFYGLNRQCWKCRMYVPASEVQQYRGQWVCPVCISQLRSEETRAKEHKPEKHPLRPLAYPETCERCGKETEVLYYWNGKFLCRSCLEDEQGSWGLVTRGPSGAGQAISLTPVMEKKEESFIEHLIGEFLAWLGLRRKRKKAPRIVAVHPQTPLDRARPMEEDPMHRGEMEEKAPQSEGLIKKVRKKKKRKKKSGREGKDVSFPEYEKKKKKGKKKNDDEGNPFSRFKDKKK